MWWFYSQFIATSALATTKSTITTTAEVPLATEGQDTTEQPEATEPSTGESLTTAQPECTGLCPKSLASEDISEIVRAHNRFRGLVNPPAANMEEMVLKTNPHWYGLYIFICVCGNSGI